MPRQAVCVRVALPSLPHFLQSPQVDKAPGQTVDKIFKGMLSMGQFYFLTPGNSTAQLHSVQGLQPHLTEDLLCGQEQEF